MSIDRPRRIFRSSRQSARRSGIPRGLISGLLGATAGAALMFAGVSTGLFDHALPSIDEISAKSGQVLVIDGETLRVGATVIRLSGVAAPARGQACAAGPDCGGRATAALAGLLHDRDVVCRFSGSGSVARPAARCEADGRDINAALVEIGWARALSPKLDPMQTDAQAHRRGMWVAG